MCGVISLQMFRSKFTRESLSMPHRQAYPTTIVTQTNSLWLSNRVVILKPLTQACGSFNRVLWSQHWLHRDLILLGETHVDTMAELRFVHAMQIYANIFSNFENTLVKQTAACPVSWV